MAQIIRFDGGAQHDRLLRAPAKSTRRAAEKAPVRGASVETKGLHSECELKRDGKDASAPLLKWDASQGCPTIHLSQSKHHT